MQWMMLQQETPDDFVIATGKQISVREFVRLSAKEAGIELEFSGSGEQEIATISSVDSEKAPAAKVGDVIVRVDPRYFRPAEVETLLGDPSNAKAKLGWTPKISFDELVAEMVREDLKSAERDELIKRHGYAPMDYHE
jgi:GDPmannose 4,6-dehydratase